MLQIIIAIVVLLGFGLLNTAIADTLFCNRVDHSWIFHLAGLSDRLWYCQVHRCLTSVKCFSPRQSLNIMQGRSMMRTIIVALLILFTIASIATAGIVVKDKHTFEPGDNNTKAGIVTVCIDGQKFLYAYGWAAHGTQRGVGAAGGVNVIQVYENVAGKVVPATCKWCVLWARYSWQIYSPFTTPREDRCQTDSGTSNFNSRLR